MRARRNTLTAETAFGRTTTRLGTRRGPIQALARGILLRKLAAVAEGQIQFVEERSRTTLGAPSMGLPDRVHVTVLDPALWPRAVFGGTIGAAESFIDGDWRTDDLVGLVRIFVRNREILEGFDSGSARALAPLHRIFHWLRPNSLRGSRRNIAAHYDLGNDFYALFLDPTMTYSAAVFERDDATLEQAQIAKMDRLCRKLDLRRDERLVEIGTGWGSLALHAAREYGCKVVTTTISDEQRRFASERVRAAGLQDRVEVRFEDYRELRGTFDKLVSVEMIEAVGQERFDDYFGACSRLLAPDGLMALQTITIDDRFYASALREVDFIQRHVFPGSTIPSVGAICGSVARATDLRLVHHEDLTPHYERTVRTWRERFLVRREEVLALGYDERFLRLWEFYLAYCEGGFAERQIGSAQMLFAKPRNRRSPVLDPV